MDWLEAIVVTHARHQHSVEAALTGIGALAVTLRDAGDTPLLEPPPDATPSWSETEVTGLFPGDTDRDRLEARIASRLPRGAIHRYRQRELAERDWERLWLDDFEPLIFGDRLCICPTHRQPPGEVAAVVWLDPGLAFGTGGHASTALCLDALAGMDLGGRRVIDYGCGSGILALAAVKLGATEVWAVDHDPQALAATRANADRNGIGGQVHPVAAGTPIEASADVLVANILAGVLCDLAATLGTLVRPGGRLLLSGILTAQAAAVRDAYRSRFGRWRRRERNGWVLLDGARR